LKRHPHGHTLYRGKKRNEKKKSPTYMGFTFTYIWSASSNKAWGHYGLIWASFSHIWPNNGWTRQRSCFI